MGLSFGNANFHFWERGFRGKHLMEFVEKEISVKKYYRASECIFSV